MGHVAAAAARNAHFAEQFARFFEEINREVRVGLGARDGTKKASGTAAQHSHSGSSRVHAVKVRGAVGTRCDPFSFGELLVRYRS